MSERIALIDYGAGNLRSVHNALAAAGAEGVAVTADADIVRAADRIVLPGVGAFGHCRDALAGLPGMIEALGDAVIDRARPFLGICVGMQLMAARGEEHGVHEGLGWIAGTVRPLVASDPRLKIPHMGWNDVDLAGSPPLLESGEAYFLHGYAVELDDPGAAYAVTDHGGPVTAAIGRDNMIGVQFHPEKSQGYGLSFLRRFLDWQP
ncbi:imidazole glycerol phosphate synthase subunit HisH [Parasphingopyxis marina]|uniref:Imidazole glycerol phosphate synthase subunit HisH n=1 Tax=Parasphingopyxis marina TaxID=2761622 RepID=A0A842HRJ4_9SPHN|nr:imidazole glycerol phosphate synthase subunit HisH [Parasphingopyxis marina]MBC2776418.1 imidazole glycerol phosphate synthase subunit HisH [Parasphingopyxis marina]